jgi:DNA polymerase V
MSLFGIQEDHLEQYLSLDQKLIRNKTATYFLRADGEAMAPLIMAKDILIVDRSIKPSTNQIIVANYNDQMFCRRLIKAPQGFILRAENLRFKDIYLTQDDQLDVFGVITSIVREFL